MVDTVDELANFGCLILTNQHRGLHVHIGFGDKFVPVDICKNVFQILTALERCLDQLHTSLRIMPGDGVSFDNSKHFNAPLSCFHSHSASDLGVDGTPTVFDWLREIEMCESHEDISRMFVVELPSATGYRLIDGHSSVLTLDNCDHSGLANEEVATGTVEFRQYEGSLDFAEVDAWIMLTATLVHYCDNASGRDVCRFAEMLGTIRSVSSI